jgi:hypothetical protein
MLTLRKFEMQPTAQKPLSLEERKSTGGVNADDPHEWFFSEGQLLSVVLPMEVTFEVDPP